MAARRLQDVEKRLWLETMRAVKPLEGRLPEVLPAQEMSAAVTPAPAPMIAVVDARRMMRRVLPRPPVEIGARQSGLDDTSWRMLGNGTMRPQRRLDLHGRQAQAAFVLLHAFLLRAQAERLRCVEIITGAGSGPEGGILRRELPLWLSRPDLRPLVLAAVHPHARNVGSVRLLLKRKTP